MKVPESSSAPLISSGTELGCIESPFGATESVDRQTTLAATCWRCRSDRSRTCWRGAVRTVEAGWRRSVTDRTGWPGLGEGVVAGAVRAVGRPQGAVERRAGLVQQR